MRFTRTLTIATIVALGAAGCGKTSGTADSSVLAELKTAASEQAASPKCADLFVEGATLPAAAEMPAMCFRDRGDLLYITVVTCADRRKFYEMEDGFEAWAFEGGVVATAPQMASDPRFGADVKTCG